MTPPAPSFVTTGARRRVSLLAAILLLAAPLAGCLGSDTDDGPDPEETFRVFLAASGTDVPNAEATLSSIGVKLVDTGATQFIPVEGEDFQLAELAQSQQAVLAAASADLNATVARTIVVFDELVAGNVSLTNVRLEVPLEYTAGPGIEATVTLALDRLVETGSPKLDHLVVTRGTDQVASITGAELEAKPRQKVVPLAQPTIVATDPDGNDTAPSFQVNTPVSLSIDIRENESAQVREAFWSFSDGSTTSGREVSHTFRQAGPQTVGVIVEGTKGQQARTNITLDIYFVTEGDGNIGLGTGGSGLINDRDVKNHRIEVPGPLTSVTVRFQQGSSGGQEGAPGNLHVELYDAEGTLIGANTDDTRVKWINETAEETFPGGQWVLRVKGDSGVAIGYTYEMEAHYLGLTGSQNDGGSES